MVMAVMAVMVLTLSIPLLPMMKDVVHALVLTLSEFPPDTPYGNGCVTVDTV